MTEKPANHDNVSGDVFHTLHAGLTVKLISTKRSKLMTCAPHESLPDVMKRNKEPYDFLPVVLRVDGSQEQIVGLFHAAGFSNERPSEGYIEQHYAPLSEGDLIGADASILDFVTHADERPCRLVISGANVVGLVSISDLQKLPVRAVLFALITGLEISMFEAIKKELPDDYDWNLLLSKGRQRKIEEEIRRSRQEDNLVDELLFTQFCDKSEILVNGFQILDSKSMFRKRMEKIQALRDSLAHANEYAASASDARNVCVIVRDLLTLREKIEVIERQDPDEAGVGASRKRAN